MSPTCDIFCTVIDNFGDIGVCWRLARQLANEYGWRVKLRVDQLIPFSKLCASVNPAVPQQCVDQVIIESWSPAKIQRAAPAQMIPLVQRQQAGSDPGADLLGNALALALEVADVVIEAFGCDLPSIYIDKMVERATRARAPIWINLEYLSSEHWVPDFHCRPSPHPRYPLIKTCFFPGLHPGTGGVLRERDLFDTRQAFLSNPSARAAIWASLCLPAPTADADATIASLFIYDHPAIERLLTQWCESASPIICIVPEGPISATLARFFNVSEPRQPRPHVIAQAGATRGSLTVYSIPFIDQNTYDRLLWISDINFVRGEDSFVRAQWAQRPLVWHAYPQANDAHLQKLDAVLQHYAVGLPEEVRSALSRFWWAWNRSSPDAHTSISLDWDDFWQHRDKLSYHAHIWAKKLAAVGDLAGHLVRFCKSGEVL